MFSRTVLAVAVSAVVVAAPGCGSSAPDPAVKLRAHEQRIAELARAFTAATGSPVRRAPDGGFDDEGPGRTELQSPQYPLPVRFGNFSIRVVEDGRARKQLFEDAAGQPLPRGSDGRRIDARSGSSLKDYGDGIVVRTRSVEPEDDDQFRRLDHVMQAALTGDRDRVPPAEHSCADPLDGFVGTCWRDGTQLTVVGSERALVAPDGATRVRSVRITSTLPGAGADGTGRGRAAGKGRRWVVVQYQLDNTSGDELLVPDLRVVVGGRSYTASQAVSLYGVAGNSRAATPKPGARLVTSDVFRLPAAAARELLARGEVDVTPFGSIGRTDRIRLAGTPTLSLAGASTD